ncbi:MAG: excinuclease ABC subunit UvrB [Chloroflexota bacterium]|nr:excinuclease ABC subunit UvrB [Chloroflexota bacterium]
MLSSQNLWGSEFDSNQFELKAPFSMTGDQPKAVDSIVQGIRKNYSSQTLKGVTGSGKTFTMANIIESVQKPTLVIAHNKTLAAQLAMEFRDFFPNNAVEYFVSYYDYYQPEAYIARTDTYIEKDAQINDEIDRLRHSATKSLWERRDVIIVSSVSCIYGLGAPEEYASFVLFLEDQLEASPRAVISRLIEMQYERNDYDFTRGRFRVRGDTIEIQPIYEQNAVRIEFFGNKIDRITNVDITTGKSLDVRNKVAIYPAKHWVTQPDNMRAALSDIQIEMEERRDWFKQQAKFIEAQRIEERTKFDVEMMREIGYCSGVENYSRHLQRREPGSRPWTLIDYFPQDALVMIDESHMTIPQLRGMYYGDKSRKQNLVDFGFRLPSALDNRPLNFGEFEQLVNQIIYVSATPADYEGDNSSNMVEQVIRPTGLLDPTIEVKKTDGQIDDLLDEIRIRNERGERSLVTTLTKKMAERLSEYLQEMGIKTHYLHSEVDTLDRTDILRDLRLGVYDVVVGINLLREGLDLPEVSLVAILDADKEGYLRSSTSLIQTIGRSARHANGHVIMYADKVTDSMKLAIDETYRRREIQDEFNRKNGIVPQGIQKEIHDINESVRNTIFQASGDTLELGDLPMEELQTLVSELNSKMKNAAGNLEFEKAAAIRDQIIEIRQVLD